MSMDDVFARFNGAKVVQEQARHPFLGAGEHRLAVYEYKRYNSAKNGPTISCVVKVLASSTLPVGSFACDQWRLNKQEQYPNSPTQIDLAADFVCKLLNATDPAAVGATIAQLCSDEGMKVQPIRGMVIDCVATANAKGTWVYKSYKNVPQTPQEIATCRAALESAPAPTASAPPPAAPPTAPTVATPAATPAAAPTGSLLGQFGIGIK